MTSQELKRSVEAEYEKQMTITSGNRDIAKIYAEADIRKRKLNETDLKTALFWLKQI